jgi:serine/threonine protein kinase
LINRYIIECLGVHANGSTIADLQSTTINVVEHASAGSLRDFIHRSMAKEAEKKGARLYSYCDALRWMTQAGKGLQFLHGNRPDPLLHGAVSLDNVLLKGELMKCWFVLSCTASLWLYLGAAAVAQLDMPVALSQPLAAISPSTWSPRSETTPC